MTNASDQVPNCNRAKAYEAVHASMSFEDRWKKGSSGSYHMLQLLKHKNVSFSVTPHARLSNVRASEMRRLTIVVEVDAVAGVWVDVGLKLARVREG